MNILDLGTTNAHSEALVVWIVLNGGTTMGSCKFWHCFAVRLNLNFVDSSCFGVHTPTATPNRSNAHENANFFSSISSTFSCPKRYTHLWYQIIPSLSANTLNPLTQIFIFTHWCHLELVSVKRAWNHFQQSSVSPSYKKLQNVTSPKSHWGRTPDLNVISTPGTRPLNNLNRLCNLHSNVWTSWC
jgi:hypothetical protein